MSQAVYSKAKFLISAAEVKQLPPDNGLEVAFAGRSNAGKSSALNLITNQTGLARVSKTPGRTQLINFFQLDATRYLVDLPGYGYAKVPSTIRERWQANLAHYVETRQSLKGIILLMDIRHPLTVLDQQMLQWIQHIGLPTHILLTKADKLTRGRALNTLLKLTKDLQDYKNVSVQLFSAPKRQGLVDVWRKLDQWLQIKAAPDQLAKGEQL